MEDNFEKKKSNTFLKVLLPIILIIAVVGAGAYFLLNKSNIKPVNAFKNVVEKAFTALEVKEDAKTASAKIELTASLDSDNLNVRAIKQYVEAAKITLNGEADLNKQIMKYNALVDFDKDTLVNADFILQNGKIYAYAKDFFSKFVEIDSEDLDMEEMTVMIEEMFKISNKISKKETNKLLKDIENEVLKFLDEQEYETSKEEIKVGNDTVKATKASLKLNEKQLAKLMTNVLTVVKNSEYIKELISTDEIDFEEQIEDAIEELKDVDTDDMTIKISLYTTGVAGEIVKAEVVAKEEEEEVITINYEKESKEKASVVFEAEGTELKLEINKKDKNTTAYTLVLPEELEGMKITVEHTKEGQYKGKIVLTVKVPSEILAGYNIDDDVTAKLNVVYDASYNVNVEETNVENSIKINDFTEQDQQELLTNFQNSKLYSLISTFMGE